MKAIPKRQVQAALRQLGFRPARTGDSSGHARWIRDDGATVNPVMRHPDRIPLGQLFALGLEVERIGLMTRRAFMALVLRAA